MNFHLEPLEIVNSMLFSALLAFQRIGMALAAPAAEAYDVITNEDGLPFFKVKVVRIDIDPTKSRSDGSLLTCLYNTAYRERLAEALCRLQRASHKIFESGSVMRMEYSCDDVWNNPTDVSGLQQEATDLLLVVILLTSLFIVTICSLLRRWVTVSCDGAHRYAY